MRVREIMRRSLHSIPLDAAVRTAAERMRELDIGMMPVAEDNEIVGTVTDRDITIRGTAAGVDPNVTTVSMVMTSNIYVCLEDDDLLNAARIMESHQIRRLMVQNADGEYTGMLTLADLARHHETEQLSAEVLEIISQPQSPAD